MRIALSQVLAAAVVAAASLPALAAAEPITSFKKNADAVVLSSARGTLQLQVWSDNAIRVTYAVGAELPALKSYTVVGKPAKAQWDVQDSPDAVTLQTAALRARVDKQTGAVSFLDLKDNPILQESGEGREIAPAVQPGVEGTLCRQSFVLPPDEGIYGLGQHQQGVFNYRGRTVRLLQQNMEAGIPVILSSKGYSLLWDNPAVTEISAGARTPAAPAATGPARGGRTPVPEGAGENVMRWTSETGKAIDYYFIYGPSADASIKTYRAITGDAPMMGKWVWGFWQCKQRYSSQEELLSVAKHYRDEQMPIDGIIQDWRYWAPGNDTWGSHTFDASRYPDPAGLFKQLHDEHIHNLISVWPKFDVGSPNSKELIANGAMFDPVIPYVFPPGKGQWYDPFSDKGREIYWRQISDQLFKVGIDGWWLDAPEPELSGKWGEFRTFRTSVGQGATVFNAFPLMHSTGIYQGQRAESDEKRVVILTRSAYAGQQRNSAITWSGDIAGTWNVLRNQVPAGLNFSVSGIPYWNTDTGGFGRSTGQGNPANPAYQELFTRWFQFSAFCPMFRVHGDAADDGLGPGKEFWRFDPKTQATWRNFVNLRYRLMPYIYSVSWQVTSNGYTMMRPLVMDFPNDQKVLSIGDQYLFGPAIMVSPVTTQGATSRSVYLPEGQHTQERQRVGNWYDFWTGKLQNQMPADAVGQTITAEAPIDSMPLYIRAGSILPLGPLVQYTDEKPDAPLELRIYRGRDGAFTLYEDEGDSYRYEKGQYATIPMAWNEATQTLTISERKGNFPGMLKSRTFNVVFVGEAHGAGVSLTDKADKVVTYSGTALTVKP